MTNSSQEVPKQIQHDTVVSWRNSLHTRITLYVGVVITGLVLLLAVIIAQFSYQIVLNNSKKNIQADARESAQRVNDMLRMIAVATESASRAVTDTELTPEQIIAMLRVIVQSTPETAGALLALEPEGNQGKAFAYHIQADGKDDDFIADGYNYRTQSWYRRTLAASQGWWSDPYFNEVAGGVWTITYNMPILRAKDGRAIGMISLDMKQTSMQQLVEQRTSTGELTVIAPNGRLAVHADPSVALHYGIYEYIADKKRRDLLPAADAATQRHRLAYTHTAMQHNNATGHRQASKPRQVRYFTVVEPIGKTGGSLVWSEPYSTMLMRINQILALLAVSSLAVILLMLFIVYKLARRISRPLEDLTVSATHLRNGEYHRPVQHGQRKDEVGYLARTLDKARTSIQKQLAEIQGMAVAQYAMEKELDIARDIQLSMVPPPQRFALAGSQLALDVHAVIEPAKAVGGDFYGYHESEGIFWFGIGDVSDKGLPAALFMARSDAILKTASRSADTPSGILKIASGDLAEGNDNCMFVTTLIGRIDLRTGDCMLASAGHDMPLVLHADGQIEQLDFGSGPVLGIEASDDFPLWRGRLVAGDSLIMWTDGITEAFNEENEAFGDERLLSCIKPGYSAAENCSKLLAEVNRFVGSAPQSDDITLMILSLHKVLEKDIKP